jgi:hypothetical protein
MRQGWWILTQRREDAKAQAGKDGQDEQDLQDRIFGSVVGTIDLVLALIFWSPGAEVGQEADLRAGCDQVIDPLEFMRGNEDLDGFFFHHHFLRHQIQFQLYSTWGDELTQIKRHRGVKLRGGQKGR